MDRRELGERLKVLQIEPVILVIMESLQFLLKALGCPFSNDLDASNHTHVVALVRWLEDRKIREYDIQERSMLNDSEQWNDHFRQYITRLGCPYTWADGDLEVLYWLASYAVSLDYDDTNLQVEDNLNSTSMASKVDEIGRIIGVSRGKQETDTDYLSRIFQKLKFQLSPNAIEAKALAQSYGSTQDEVLKDFPLGFDTQDKVVNQVALVLKMLYLSDFRDLQNEINSLLVLVQDYTANPRLNASLGRVGV